MRTTPRQHLPKLTDRQEAFALALLAGQSEGEAYRHAYPKSRAWAASSVDCAGAKLAGMAKVSQRVRQLREEAAERVGLDHSLILAQLAAICFSDIAKVMTADGKVKLPHELDPCTRAAIASFKIDEKGRVEYRFWDKNVALEEAMKHLGLFERDNSQKLAVVGDPRVNR